MRERLDRSLSNQNPLRRATLSAALTKPFAQEAKIVTEEREDARRKVSQYHRTACQRTLTHHAGSKEFDVETLEQLSAGPEVEPNMSLRRPASGLTFIAAAADNYLRGFDSQTGEELWRGRLPAGG